MSDVNSNRLQKEVTTTNLQEGGVYAQFLTGGMYVGYNGNKGLSIGLFHQVSGGVAAYNSMGITISLSNGIDTNYNVGAGFAPPTGAPTPITGAAWYNFVDGTYTGQLGASPPYLVDYVEGGIYSTFAQGTEWITLNPHVPVGQVSSMRYPGQFGTVPVGYEANALDVIGDSRTLSDYYKNSGSDLSNAIEARTDASVYQFNDRGNYYAGSGHPGYDARSPDSGGSSGGGSGQPPLPRKRQPPSDSGGGSDNNNRFGSDPHGPHPGISNSRGGSDNNYRFGSDPHGPHPGISNSGGGSNYQLSDKDYPDDNSCWGAVNAVRSVAVGFGGAVANLARGNIVGAIGSVVVRTVALFIVSCPFIFSPPAMAESENLPEEYAWVQKFFIPLGQPGMALQWKEKILFGARASLIPVHNFKIGSLAQSYIRLYADAVNAEVVMPGELKPSIDDKYFIENHVDIDNVHNLVIKDLEKSNFSLFMFDDLIINGKFNRKAFPADKISDSLLGLFDFLEKAPPVPMPCLSSIFTNKEKNEIKLFVLLIDNKISFEEKEHCVRLHILRGFGLSSSLIAYDHNTAYEDIHTYYLGFWLLRTVNYCSQEGEPSLSCIANTMKAYLKELVNAMNMKVMNR